MRQKFERRLEILHTSLIQMGALCEDAIDSAAKALLGGEDSFRETALRLEQEVNVMEQEIEQMCARIILHEQPVARDLRRVTSAQRMITDMERISDQAADIAELSAFMRGSPVKSDVHINDMARATISMVTDALDSFVCDNLTKAQAVIAYDDVVDGLFAKIKQEIIDRLSGDSSVAGDCLDLLMIAKYFERIGDHAENIAEWVIYSMTGTRAGAGAGP
jgi:phosphate transport system protein